MQPHESIHSCRTARDRSSIRACSSALGALMLLASSCTLDHACVVCFLNTVLGDGAGSRGGDGHASTTRYRAVRRPMEAMPRNTSSAPFSSCVRNRCENWAAPCARHARSSLATSPGVAPRRVQSASGSVTVRSPSAVPSWISTCAVVLNACQLVSQPPPHAPSTTASSPHCVQRQLHDNLRMNVTVNQNLDNMRKG